MESFESFYGSNYSDIVRMLRAGGASLDDARDAAQEAFARALVRWRRLAGEEWGVGWVLVTASNYSRRHTKRKDPASPVADAHQPDETESIVRNTDLLAELRGLPAKQRLTIFLFYYLDLPISQVAMLLGISEGSVKTHLSRARKSLRSIEH